MAERRIPVFFYGLFMDADLLRGKGLAPAGIRKASVSGYALRIGNRATLVTAPGARAYGVVMDLTHAEIEQAYSEATVGNYRPEALLAEFEDGSRAPALCYNLAVAPAASEKNTEYAAKLRNLAQRLGLPLQYVESIG